MNAVVLLIFGVIVLILGYLLYGRWLAKTWGIDPSRPTPAHTKQDGMDYVPAKAPVLMGHHFSSIAGAGPINGPIQAAVFGWVPVLLWVLIGGIFIGATHDFGALVASLRHGGASIGEVIADSVGKRAKKLFLIFSYLTLILVVAAFSSIVANTFCATYIDAGAVHEQAELADAYVGQINDSNVEMDEEQAALYSEYCDTVSTIFQILDSDQYTSEELSASTEELETIIPGLEEIADTYGITLVAPEADGQAAGTYRSIVDTAASNANATTAMVSILFIVISVIFGFFVYRKNANLVVSSALGIVGIVVCLVIGLNFHPLYLSSKTWMIVVGLYILVASVTPVWILLQPRDYLSSFLLYALMILAVIGIVGAHPNIDIPAFTGVKDTISVDVLHGSANLGYIFPALFVTIACGAISGFHSLISSGTTSKQLDNEKDALPIAFGSMLIECALAIISLCAMGYVWNKIKAGDLAFVPTTVFAGGIASMLSAIPGLSGTYDTAYSLLVLAVSVFCLTSLDTATRLGRYMFQEFWLDEGEDPKKTTGYKKVLTNPVFATLITVVLGIALGLTGYAKIWALFGAANQLLAALALLAVCVWLGKVGKNNKMFFVPMFFMLIVTVTSLIQTIITNLSQLSNPVDSVVWYYVRAILAFLLVVLAVILAVESINAIRKQKSKN